MRYNNQACRIKHLNADQAERAVIENLCALSQDDTWLNTTIEDLNRDLKQTVAPMEEELKQIKARIVQLDQEVDNFVQALAGC